MRNRKALMATAVVLASGLALAGCGSSDDPTGSGDYVHSQEQVSKMINSAQLGERPLYCESAAGEATIASWLRGDDDYVMVVNDTLGLARDPGAVTIWDKDQGVGLELLAEELSMMELDMTSMSSEVLFENMVTSGAGEMRCRNLSEKAYPELEGVRVHTMADVASGEMPQGATESLFASFTQF